MRYSITIVKALITMLVFAQNNNPCAHLDNLYTQKVEENVALNARIRTLEKDSATRANQIANLQRDTNQVHKQLRETNARLAVADINLKAAQQQLNKCRKDSASLQKQLEDKKFLTLQQYKDSLDRINAHKSFLLDSISKLVALKNAEQKQKEELMKVSSNLELLTKRYEKSTVDELYAKHDKGELLLYKELCTSTNKKVPGNIEHALVCFKAQEQLAFKYNKVSIDQLQKQLLPLNSKCSKQLLQRIQNYKEVNTAANDLWKQIHNEVCDKQIEADDFLQIQAKRQIWQRAQIFLNKYPDLSSDYPYVNEQIQAMLREIWKDANNFNAIKNPFE